MNPDELVTTSPELSSRIQALEGYLQTGKGFVCLYGRTGLAQGRVDLVLLDKAPPGDHLARVDSIALAIGPLLEGKKESIVFVDQTDPVSHQEGFDRAWEFYAELKTALLQHEGIEPMPFAKCDLFLNQAKLDRRPENTIAFRSFGAAKFNGDEVFVAAMSPRYLDGDLATADQAALHPRYAPVMCYAITKSDQVAVARAGSPKIAQFIMDEIYRRTGSVYLQALPYILPDDERHTMKFHRVQEFAAHIAELGVRGAPVGLRLIDAPERLGQKLFDAMITGSEVPYDVTAPWGEPEFMAAIANVIFTGNPQIKQALVDALRGQG